MYAIRSYYGCVSGGGYYVFMNEHEAEGIRNYLRLSRNWFRRRYLCRLPDGDVITSYSIHYTKLYDADAPENQSECKTQDSCRPYGYSVVEWNHGWLFLHVLRVDGLPAAAVASGNASVR